jgi:hypothetical protein
VAIETLARSATSRIETRFVVAVHQSFHDLTQRARARQAGADDRQVAMVTSSYSTGRAGTGRRRRGPPTWRRSAAT